MNNFTDFTERILDVLDNGTRAFLFASFKTLENIGSKGVNRCKKDADQKRKASTIKTSKSSSH